MLISGNEPSSVILCQTKWFQKLKMIAESAKQAEAKRDGLISQQSYNFITDNFDAQKALRINRSRP